MLQRNQTFHELNSLCDEIDLALMTMQQQSLTLVLSQEKVKNSEPWMNDVKVTVRTHCSIVF